MIAQNSLLPYFAHSFDGLDLIVIEPLYDCDGSGVLYHDQ